MLQNIFGDISLDSTIKALIQKFGRFSFNNLSALRTTFDGVPQPVTVSSGTVTVVTSVGQSNISFGDQGKLSTVIQVSANNFYNSVGQNMVRS
jgi:hypothetical protein